MRTGGTAEKRASLLWALGQLVGDGGGKHRGQRAESWSQMESARLSPAAAVQEKGGWALAGHAAPFKPGG